MMKATKRSQKPAYATGGRALGCQAACAGGTQAAGYWLGAGVGGGAVEAAGIGGTADVLGTGCPQALQKATPCGTFAPHFEQNIATP